MVGNVITALGSSGETPVEAEGRWEAGCAPGWPHCAPVLPCFLGQASSPLFTVEALDSKVNTVWALGRFGGIVTDTPPWSHGPPPPALSSVSSGV